MNLADLGQLALIAVVTLPIAGVPFAVFLYLDYRRYRRAGAGRAPFHVVRS